MFYWNVYLKHGNTIKSEKSNTNLTKSLKMAIDIGLSIKTKFEITLWNEFKEDPLMKLVFAQDMFLPSNPTRMPPVPLLEYNPMEEVD